MNGYEVIKERRNYMDNSNELHELINHAINGNRAAFGQIYEITIKDVYRTVHFLVDNKADSEDIIQEIYVQLHKSLPNFNLNKPFRPWLMGLVIKQVSASRRKNWMLFRIINKKSEYLQEATEQDFSDKVVENLYYQQLRNRIMNLSYKLKQVVILHYLHEYSQEEVAKILNIPLGTVKSRINSALHKLRQSQHSSTNPLRRVENQNDY